jgi:hypothetical protein
MEVAIDDTSRLMNMLKMIDGSAELEVEDNAFRMIGENFEGIIIMRDKESLNCDMPPEKWDNLAISSYDEGFAIDAEIFDVARKSVGEFTKKDSSDITSKHLRASVKDGLLTIKVEDEAGDAVIAKAVVDYDKNVSADYGSTMLEFVSVMKGNVTMSFKDDYPMLITSENGNSVVQWFVAPILPDSTPIGSHHD